MSTKSLLQIILFLLIVLIIGGIYFLYFYSKPISNKLSIRENIDEIGAKSLNKNISLDQELLEDTKYEQDNILKKDTAHDESKVIQNVEAAQSNTNKEINQKTYKSQNQISLEKNITKNIEYITTNKDGDIFKILAEYGKTNFKNSNILDLENVNGEINSNDAPKIFIKSDYAKYNYNNQNSKFFGNVKINYENKEITCDNLDLNINENIAIAYNNVIMIDQNSKMRAENVVMDIVTKDININSKNKVEVSIN